MQTPNPSANKASLAKTIGVGPSVYALARFSTVRECERAGLDRDRGEDGAAAAIVGGGIKFYCCRYEIF